MNKVSIIKKVGGGKAPAAGVKTELFSPEKRVFIKILIKKLKNLLGNNALQRCNLRLQSFKDRSGIVCIGAKAM